MDKETENRILDAVYILSLFLTERTLWVLMFAVSFFHVFFLKVPFHF